MIGLRRERAKASAACCETVSDRIILPIDMKKLEEVRYVPIGELWGYEERSILPKSCTRAHHVLS